jgi:hypothetical protein
MVSVSWWLWIFLLPLYGLIVWGVIELVSPMPKRIYGRATRLDIARAWSAYLKRLRKLDQEAVVADPSAHSFRLVNEAFCESGGHSGTDETKLEMLARADPPIRVRPVFATLAVIAIAYVFGAVVFLVFAAIAG